jgi:hypothetical protein
MDLNFQRRSDLANGNGPERRQHESAENVGRKSQTLDRRTDKYGKTYYVQFP